MKMENSSRCYKRSRINPVLSAKDALDTAISQVDGLNSAEELSYLIGTGYGRNKVPLLMRIYQR